MSDEQERIARDFSLRDKEEQAAFLENTWCNACQKIDLGMSDPQEYECLGRIFVEGRCNVCGGLTTTEIIEGDEDE